MEFAENVDLIRYHSLNSNSEITNLCLSIKSTIYVTPACEARHLHRSAIICQIAKLFLTGYMLLVSVRSFVLLLHSLNTAKLIFIAPWLQSAEAPE